MTALSYAALFGAIVTFILLLVRPVWGLYTLALMVPFLNAAVPRAGAGINAETALFAVALIPILQSRPVLPPMRVVAPIAAYFASMLFGFAIMATWYEPGPHGGLTLFDQFKGVKSVLWPTLALFIAFSIGRTREIRWMVLVFVAIGFGLTALTGLGGLGGGEASYVATDPARVSGVLYRNPNHLGGFLSVLGVVPLTIFFSRTSAPPFRLVCGAVYAVSVVIIIITQSRGAWLAYLVGSATWLFLVNRRLLIPVALAGLLMFTTLYSLSLLPEPIAHRIERTFTQSQRVLPGTGTLGRIDPSAASRVALHLAGAEMFVDSPVWGHGYSGFRYLGRDYTARYGLLRSRYRGMPSESLLITIAVENGLLGLSIAGWITLVLLSMAVPLVRRSEPERDVGVMLVSMLAALSVLNLTQNAMYIHETSISFWLLAGLAIRAHRDRFEPSVSSIPDAP